MRQLPPYLASLPLRSSPGRLAAGVALIYLLTGGLWLALSEGWLLRGDTVDLAAVRMRSWAGVALSATVFGLLTWTLARLAWRRMEDDQRLRERLYEIIDALPDPAAVRDLKGRYVIWNHAAEAFYGITQDEVLGKTPSQVYPDDMARAFLEGDRQAVEQGVHEVAALRIPPLLGKPARIVNVRISPIRSLDPQQRLRGVVSIVHDITAIEAQRVRLEMEDARLRLALQASGDGLWDWDLEADVATYSDGFERLLRYTGDDFRRDFLFRDRLHPDDRESALQAVRHCLATGAAFDCRYRLQCFDGQWRLFHGRGVQVVDRTGRRHFCGLLSAAPDDAASDTLAPEALLFQSPLQGLMVLDRQFNIVRANPTICRFLGEDSSQLIGSSVVRLLTRSARPSADYLASQKVLAGHTHWQGLLRIRRADGQPLDVLATVSAISGPDGAPAHYVAVFNDASRLREQLAEHEARHAGPTALSPD